MKQKTAWTIDRKLDNKTVCGVGQVVVNFQQLEWTIVELIGLLSGNEAEAQKKAAKQKFSWLCKELKSLFSEKKMPPTLAKRFDDLMSQMKDVNELRDQVVHSWWFKDHLGRESRMKFVQRKSAHLDSATIDYESSAQRISLLSDALEQLVADLGSAKVVRRWKLVM